MIPTGKERFPQRRLPTERGGFLAYCPTCKRVLYRDEVRQQMLPPFRRVCARCGQFAQFNLDPKIFG